MNNARISDVMVQVAATVIAAGLLAIAAGIRGLFKRLSSLEQTVREILPHVYGVRRDFNNSHEVFEDGEYHHKRRGRV